MKKIIYYTMLSIITLLSNYNANSQTSCSAYFVDSAHFSNGCTVDFYHFNNNPTHTSYLYYNFGDGTSANNTTSPNNISVTTHTYTSSGWYSVCLTMWDSSFCQNTYCDSIYVNCGGSSNCSALFVDTVHNGCSVTFNYSTPWPTYLSYYFSWTFGDGTSLSGSPNTNPNIPYPTHTYTSSGWYNVCLSIIDSVNQCQAYYCDSIYVNCGSSNCSVNWTHTTQNCNTTFISTVTPSNNGWNYSWNFGDGNSSNQANPSHTYSSNGMYNVCLTAWNNISGCSDTVCYPVYITNCGGTSNCQIMFTTFDSACYTYFIPTATPFNPNYNYIWNFGDGNSSNQQYPVHQYNASGLYYACVTIWDSTSTCQATYCDTVAVNCIPNSINEVYGLDNFKLYPNPATSQINISFNLTQSDYVSIKLTDISGRVIGVIIENEYLSSGNRNVQYNLNGLNSGIYFVNTIVGSEISVDKFIKH